MNSIFEKCHKRPKILAKIGCIPFKGFVVFFLEHSFITVNISIRQKRGVCCLVMSEVLGRNVPFVI